MRLSKILLPVDFSEPCTSTAHYAKVLACHFHSELTIAHVFELQTRITVGLETGLPPTWYDERRQDARRTLEAFHADDFRNLPVRRVLLEGNVARSIVDLACSEHADLIVMPTHGYGPIRRFLLGSVTAKVLHDAESPVLTGVHITEPTLHEPVFFRNIICAIDFDAAGEKALRWAAQFAGEFRARLTLVHAVPRHGGEAYYYDQAVPAMLQRIGYQRMEELIKRVDVQAEVVVEPGSVADVVRNASSSKNANLVVIGRPEHPGLMGRLRSNTYAVVRESPCPVVSV